VISQWWIANTFTPIVIAVIGAYQTGEVIKFYRAELEALK